MRMIIVTQCCCGCTVRSGSLIIGVLSAISALLDFIYGVALISVYEDEVGLHTDEHGAPTLVMSKGELVVSVIISAGMFVASVVLIFGIVKERLKFIASWLLVYVAYLVLVSMYILQIIIIVLIHNGRAILLWEIPVFLIVFAITAYCIIVVNSHYRNLKDNVTLPPRPPLIITV